MKLSIVTPCYNAIRYIANCVASVRHSCRGRDYEHIVVDGQSTDGTLEYLRTQPDIHLVSEADSGMYDALNKGIALASGDIIGHLNSDEQYSRPGLLSAWDALKDETVDAIMSPTVMLNGRLEFIQLFNQIVKPTLLDVYWHMPIQTCSFLYRKSLWSREPYSTKFRLVSDHAWFRKQMELGLRLKAQREPIGLFTWHGNNLSSTQTHLQEDALSDIDRKSNKIYRAKLIYRLRKLLAGGYLRILLHYQIINNGSAVYYKYVFPCLKIRKFDKKTKS
jgi:glycosyltransferase involved in cell wall biosynthesis